MKLCIDCRHYSCRTTMSEMLGVKALAKCKHKSATEVSLVDGVEDQQYCQTMRMIAMPCGPEGTLWGRDVN